MECKGIVFGSLPGVSQVLMEPKWNVKISRLHSAQALSSVLMEPKWNVKPVQQSVPTAPAARINGTKVECKGCSFQIGRN